MKNNNEIRFKVTSEQHNKIQQKAKKLGWTIKEYVLAVALNSEIKIEIKSPKVELIPPTFINSY